MNLSQAGPDHKREGTVTLRRYSICIPNFNYEQYLGETIASVLAQTYPELQVLVSDNASTDRSVEVVKAVNDQRVQLQVNPCNVGFAGNLDRVASMADGEWCVMLSSDDRMRADALEHYNRLLDQLGERACGAVVSSSLQIIDAEGRPQQTLGPDPELWKSSDRVTDLAGWNGVDVYRVAAGEMLRRCLLSMKNPFHFAATAYPRVLYERVGGYGGGRLINPDKWFHWKLLGGADEAWFIDAPLFDYRWHASNQTSLQQSTGALKYAVDDYASVLELETKLLAAAGLTREQVEQAYIEHDVGRHGLATLGRGDAVRAARIWHFGWATYPSHARRNAKVWCLGWLLRLDGLGRWLAEWAYRRHRARHADRF